MPDFLNERMLTDGCTAVVRPYMPDDYSLVKGILEASHLFDPIWDSEESLRKMVEQCSTAILVATVEDSVVGSVYVHSCGHWAYLWRLATQPSYRNHGIATLLLDSAEQVIKDRGVPEVCVLVGAMKYSLKDFYLRRGWKSERLVCIPLRKKV